MKKKLDEYFKALRVHPIYTAHFTTFINYKQGKEPVQAIINMENSFADYITNNKAEAKQLKSSIGNYYKILNLIEFVLDLDKNIQTLYF